jgi:hypothetical protein
VSPMQLTFLYRHLGFIGLKSSELVGQCADLLRCSAAACHIYSHTSTEYIPNIYAGSFCRRRISTAQIVVVLVVVHIMLRDLTLVNPKLKCVQKILVSDFGYPRACRFRKHQIENRFPALALPTFFKT